ncbi:MAG TPA: hypothetical protein VJW94_17805 [Candidatus Acidoferrum sp.]|nr:hypothetical protein [Candidatus Acidoferrum sp.]
MINIKWKALKYATMLVLAFAFQESVGAQDIAPATSVDMTGAAAEPQAATGNVPRLIKFSGVATDPDGKPATGTVSLTFTLYKTQEEGSALWAETQSEQLDAQGHYTVLLGSGSTAGLPLDLFASGNALWLGVQPELPGESELPRVLLVAVPYALKAADADTLGGKPASAYLLAQGEVTASSGQATNGNLAAAPQSPLTLRPGQQAETSNSSQNTGPNSPVGGSGTFDFLPIWNGSQTLGNSILFQVQDKVGVGTLTPGARLDATSLSIAVRGTSSGTSGAGVLGNAAGTSGNATGVFGQSASSSGTGVVGVNNAATGYANGVYGQSASTSGSGVSGNATATSGYTSGVYGQSSSVNGTGVYGSSANWVGVGGMGATLGVWGDSATAGGGGVAGYSDATSGYGNGVYGQSASGNGIGVAGSSTSTSGGTGVMGVANATTGSPAGVYGLISATSGAAVLAVATATSGYTNGVWANNASTQGTGVSGNASAPSGGATGVLGSSVGAQGGIGVWGSYQATSGSGVGVRGDIESNASGTAGLFINASGQGLILSGVSGSSFNQVFTVDSSGNLDISGNLTVAGSKSARVKLQNGREVALYAVESPENWFEDFGTAQLQGGAAQVALEPGFLQTVDTATDYHVFLTPKGDCNGLYVASTTSGGFEVREMGGGTASVAFDYRIVAHRRGFESVRLQDVHLPPGPKDMQARVASMRPATQTVVAPTPKVTPLVLSHPVEQPHP